MRTTLDLDDALLGALSARYPNRSKAEAIQAAVAAHLADDAATWFRERGGLVEIEDVSADRRRPDHRTCSSAPLTSPPSPRPAPR